MMTNDLALDRTIQYVNYASLPEQTPNRIRQPYTCIITNQSWPLAQFPPGQIRAHHRLNSLKATELAQPTSQTFHILSPEDLPRFTVLH